MLIDKLVEQIKRKKNPCIVGLDPEWDKLPDCYRREWVSRAEAILQWAKDVIDVVADIVPAVKPQMAFYEVYGAAGVEVFEQVVKYAHSKDLIVVDDSKRNDIGNTARAYAFAHLSKEGPINADFLTVSPFLGTDSLQPFLDVAAQEDKGLFILVKTSNPSSVEISEAMNIAGEKISEWLADYIYSHGADSVNKEYVGESGYSSIGAVVGATFPEEAAHLRKRMKNNFFLVPGFGAQGGSVEDIVSCFNGDGLGALVSSSRGIIYKHLELKDYDGTREMYMDIVRAQAVEMQKTVYAALKTNCGEMVY